MKKLLLKILSIVFLLLTLYIAYLYFFPKTNPEEAEESRSSYEQWRNDYGFSEGSDGLDTEPDPFF